MASLTELADALYREEVQRARAMRAEEKLLEGPRLFDRACRLMTDGVRHRHPELDEQAVMAKVIEQLARLKALESS
jgi:hypothetical protein